MKRGLAGVLLTVCLAAVGVPDALAAPTCKTPKADGHQPPCNPYLADSPYPTAHANNFATGSTYIAGPREVGDVTPHAYPAVLIPIGTVFSPLYPDGGRAVWLPSISAQQDSLLLKIDEQTGRIIDAYHRTLEEGEVPQQEPAISRVYGFLDRRNVLYRAAGAAIDVYGDRDPGVRTSPIRLIRRWPLPERAMCRPGDFVVGLTLLYNGRMAFSTNLGMIGVAKRGPQSMGDELVVRSINGPDCADPEISTGDLESTTNSVVADPGGGIYPLTDQAQHKLRYLHGKLEHVWRAEYRHGTAEGGGVRLDAGSGSTPTLMGTHPGDDRFVVITDGQKLMHLTLIWRNRIPRDWKGLPGRPRRIACEHPITFGDPSRTASSSEQSVVVRGYGSYVPNNELTNGAAVTTLPIGQTPQMALAGLLGQFPQFAPSGFERIDWKPRTRTCQSRWANTEVSIPNGVPYVSSGSRMVYGIGQRAGVNGLEGMDMRTGKSLLWVPSGPAPGQNAFFSATTIGSDGSVWTGGFSGYTKFERVPVG